MSTAKVDRIEERTTDAGITVGDRLHLESTRMGTATLVAGTVVVPNVTVTANTKVILSRKTQGAAPGHLSWSVIAATSFTILSSSGTDDATVTWILVEQS